MANLVVVCGPQAVGKMTVAESIRDKLKYNLMINHDSIEVSDRIFGFATPAQREFNSVFRREAFNIAIKYNVDLVFTYVCAFDIQEDKDYLMSLEELFTSHGGNFYFIELNADLDIRLQRNETLHRIERKPSKKDIAWSRNNLLYDMEKHKLNSDAGEFLFQNHMKIDNSYLEPDQVADMVISRFQLTANEKEEKEYKFGV